MSLNKLVSLDENTFRGLTQLEIIDLHFNQLEKLEPSLFQGLTNLKKINLRRNKIIMLDAKCLRGRNYLIKQQQKETFKFKKIKD